jgi:hypothetical protein
LNEIKPSLEACVSYIPLGYRDNLRKILNELSNV